MPNFILCTGLTVDRPNALKSVDFVDIAIETSSDKESRKKCKEHMSSSDLVWVQLHDFADLQQTGDNSPENIQVTCMAWLFSLFMHNLHDGIKCHLFLLDLFVQ